MSKLVVTNRNGTVNVLNGNTGLLVMEIIRDAGNDELLALFGGFCSWATCHVYVDAAFSATLPQMSDDENHLLDSSDHRQAGSRLSCQLPFNAELDRLTITITAED